MIDGPVGEPDRGGALRYPCPARGLAAAHGLELAAAQDPGHDAAHGSELAAAPDRGLGASRRPGITAAPDRGLGAEYGPGLPPHEAGPRP